MGGYKTDPTAFVFSIDERKTFKPLDPNKAVYHSLFCGPCFGGFSLNLWEEPFDKEFGGGCITEGKGFDNHYDIPCDSEGNSILTGEGSGSKKNHFTCIDCEIY